MTNEKSIVGDLITFRGLVYAPMNENGVIYLFGKVSEDLHMYVEEIKPGFPDCIARRFTGKGWERIRVEFEFRSSHFKAHGHDPALCDMVICWEHAWKDCPLEIIELRTAIEDMDNPPMKRPGAGTEEPVDLEQSFDKLFDHAGTQPEPRRGGAPSSPLFWITTRRSGSTWARSTRASTRRNGASHRSTQPGPHCSSDASPGGRRWKG